MNNNMIDLELYEKTKIGVEHKLLRRKKKKKRVTLCATMGILFLCANATAYASSEEYRSWLSIQLGLKANTTINVGKSTMDEKISMEVLSYYRVNNTVVMSIRFQHSDGKSFSEDLNIEFIEIDKNTNSSGEILSSYSYLSDDKKSVLTMLTMNVETEKITMGATNLISMMTGECLYNGNWKLEVDVSEQTGDMKKIKSVIPVSIEVGDKEYKIKEINHIANALFFKCDVKTIESTEESKYSSIYGGQVTLEYKNGEKNTDYYCVPDKDGNLVLLLGDANQLKNLSQIYIDGKKIIE